MLLRGVPVGGVWNGFLHGLVQREIGPCKVLAVVGPSACYLACPALRPELLGQLLLVICGQQAESGSGIFYIAACRWLAS